MTRSSLYNDMTYQPTPMGGPAMAGPMPQGGALAGAGSLGGGPAAPAQGGALAGGGFLQGLHGMFADHPAMMMQIGSALLGGATLRDGLAAAGPAAMKGIQADREQAKGRAEAATLSRALAADPGLNDLQRRLLTAYPQAGVSYLVRAMQAGRGRADHGLRLPYAVPRHAMPAASE